MSLIQQITTFITSLFMMINSYVGMPQIPTFDLSGDASTTNVSDASTTDTATDTGASVVDTIISPDGSSAGTTSVTVDTQGDAVLQDTSVASDTVQIHNLYFASSSHAQWDTNIHERKNSTYR